MRERRIKRRNKLKAMLGGRCKCGSLKKLEFDHIDRKEKSFTISMGLDKPWKVLVVEVKKCQLLCKKCHIKKTAKDLLPKHGTVSRYIHKKKPCKCKKCKEAKSRADKKYKKKYRKKLKNIPK